MSHGKNCDCMICGVGKKMGMIEKGEKREEKEHSHGHDSESKACEHCV